MRFLFGIVIGAALTLLVATTADAPTNPVLQQLQNTWQQFIHGTGELLFRQPADSVGLVTPASAADQAELLTAELELDLADMPVAADISATPVTPVTPLMPETSVTSDMLLNAEPAAELTSTATPADYAIATTATDTLLPMIAAATDLADASTASVWVPFHSERSAIGFANRLSEQFAYPFAVQRQGPGAYQVVFSYENPDDREAMLLEIAEITGL